MNIEKFKVVEIFSSIDGEGSRAGLPCTFIRLHLCNLHCSYCDSTYACEGEEYTLMTLDEILAKVDSIGIPAITLTGGEPLLKDNIYELIRQLSIKNYWVNIETNGSIDLSKLNKIRNKTFGTIMVTMDWKCYSSGMTDFMVKENLKSLNSHDVLKFVVGDDRDLNQMKDLLNGIHADFQFFVSPVFGKIEPKRLVEFVLENHLNNVRVQLQLHKFIWPADMRGV